MSKKFSFRLDAALRQRVREEQTAQMVYARAAQAVLAARSVLDTLRDQATEGRRESIAPGAVMNTVGRMHVLLYLDQADLNARRQEQVVASRIGEVEEARQALLHAATRRRALERLRERRLEEHTAEDRLQLEKELDERTTMRYLSAKA
jgi:flagellar export protein FliJ